MRVTSIVIVIRRRGHRDAASKLGTQQLTLTATKCLG
jgi:hypothetical protein